MSPTRAVFASPIQSILLVERMERGHLHRFEATSLPGHLLHYVLQGRVVQKCNGRRCELRPGSVLWYHEDEWVRGEVVEAPWVWVSVNFVAPPLPPPPFEARLRHEAPDAPAPLRTQFEALLGAWNAETPPLQRALRCHGALLGILDALLAPDQSLTDAGGPSGLWWEIESEIRRDLSREVGLDTLQRLSGKSAATIARACHAAVGQAPMQRVKQVRLSLARGLVHRSSLSLSEIAAQVGYPRLHEFSRDFKKHFAAAPSHERQQFQAQSERE